MSDNFNKTEDYDITKFDRSSVVNDYDITKFDRPSVVDDDDITKLDRPSVVDDYDITEFDRPSVAADIAVLTIMEEEENNYRKLPDMKLKLLMVKREEAPYKGKWCLPGGFIRRGETIEQSAIRELKEETGITGAYLEQVAIFSDPDRDPRGWIISTAFLALVDGDSCMLKQDTGADAGNATWFNVELRQTDTAMLSDSKLVNTYLLELKSESNSLSARLRETSEYVNRHRQSQYEIIEDEGLAFDHAKLVLCLLQELRRRVNEGNIAFELMPELFTLTDLQRVYEILLDTKLYTAGFRRKIIDLVLETEHISEGAGHRPAKLYRRNPQIFGE